MITLPPLALLGASIVSYSLTLSLCNVLGASVVYSSLDGVHLITGSAHSELD